MTSRPPSVILNPKSRHTATLIFLHGLGDTGHGWAAAMNSIRPDFLKIVCPTAPSIPVTLNMGMRMPAWYDIKTLDTTDPSKREDLDGVLESADYLSQLIKDESTSEIPRSRIIIGGFSQGGAIALTTLSREPRSEPLAGCMALSTYFPGNKPGTSDEISKTFGETAQILTPVLQCHGEDDEMISIERGQLTADLLKTLVKEHTFVKYPYMGHECNEEELRRIKTFVHEVLK